MKRLLFTLTLIIIVGTATVTCPPVYAQSTPSATKKATPSPTIIINKLKQIEDLKEKIAAAEKNNIRTDGGYEYYYPYKEAEESLKSAGYDVIVFVPSIEEDLGRITCGNAILSGTLPDVPYKEVVT